MNNHEPLFGEEDERPEPGHHTSQALGVKTIQVTSAQIKMRAASRAAVVYTPTCHCTWVGLRSLPLSEIAPLFTQ